MEKECQDRRHTKKVFESNRVDITFVARSELDLHEIQDVGTARDEEELHQDEIGTRWVQQVQIPRHEHDRVHKLRLERNAST